ncbi:hypothetical protein HRbin27_00416 [bacterium HR27]|nr:hypothetical protein HRbin27_00416 [bacterium HR27]
MDDVAPGEFEQLQNLVQAHRVGPIRIDEREQLGQPVAPERRREFRLTGAHPVPVALERIDLAVVRDAPERLGQLPGRKSVRAVALVEERESTLHQRILEIGVERCQIAGDEQALVDDRSAGERRHEEVACPDLLRDPFGLPASQIEPALELHRIDVSWPRCDHLLDARHRLPCLLAQDVRVDRDLPPPDVGNTLRVQRFGQCLLAPCCKGRVVGRKKHETSSQTLGLDGEAVQASQLAGQQLARQLYCDTSTIARLRVGGNRTTVGQIDDCFQCVAHDRVAGLPAEVSDEAGSTGIVLVLRAVQWCVLSALFHRHALHRVLDSLPSPVRWSLTDLERLRSDPSRLFPAINEERFLVLSVTVRIWLPCGSDRLVARRWLHQPQHTIARCWPLRGTRWGSTAIRCRTVKPHRCSHRTFLLHRSRAIARATHRGLQLATIAGRQGERKTFRRFPSGLKDSHDPVLYASEQAVPGWRRSVHRTQQCTDSNREDANDAMLRLSVDSSAHSSRTCRLGSHERAACRHPLLV